MFNGYQAVVKRTLHDYSQRQAGIAAGQHRQHGMLYCFVLAIAAARHGDTSRKVHPN
jgi:hypothetical protein